MLVSYLRSSSYSSFDWCQHRWYLEYGLGLKPPSGKSADIGSVVHKALEMLAWKKFKEQNGETAFKDEEMNKEYVAADVLPDQVLDDAYDHYSNATPHHNESPRNKWTEADRELCRTHMWNTLNFDGGLYDPRNRHVLAPEQYFDLPIEEDWAHHTVRDPHTGESVDVQYSIKGTMDLVTLDDSPDTIELLDWKTGARKDWVKNKPKGFLDLLQDPQLLLYYYALCRLYPDVPYIFPTIFFIKDGGPFTLPFDRATDTPRALEMLRKRFEEIRETEKPSRIISDDAHNWRCFRLCDFFKKTAIIDGVDTGRRQCEYYHSEVQQLGLEKVMAKHGVPGAWHRYSDGGGQSNRGGK